MIHKNFQIELPQPIKVGDYVQTTKSHDNLLGRPVFGRVYSMTKRKNMGILIHFITKNKDKQSMDEHWLIKVGDEE